MLPVLFLFSQSCAGLGPRWERKTIQEMGKKTLCELEELLKKDLEAYKQLVKDGKYICRKCGRVANKEKRLCKPAEL